MVNMTNVLWATAAGIVSLGMVVEVGGFGLPAPLDQIYELPLDVLFLGVAVVGWVIA